MKKALIIITAMLMLVACGREDRNKRAEDKGQTLVEKKSSYLKGIGKGLKEKGKDAAEALSEGVSEVFKGASEGFDKSLVQLDVRLSDNLKELVSVSRSEIHTNDSLLKKEIIVYTVFEKDCAGQFILKAFDKNDKEIGRSVVAIKEQADKSRFVEFPFDDRTSFSLIQYLVLDMKQNK
jgi:hypothetical protein